jgi:hypothetical protein
MTFLNEIISLQVAEQGIYRSFRLLKKDPAPRTVKEL